MKNKQPTITEKGIAQIHRVVKHEQHCRTPTVLEEEKRSMQWPEALVQSLWIGDQCRIPTDDSQQKVAR